VINYASSRHPTPHAFADGKLRFTPIRYAAVEVFAVTLSPDSSLASNFLPFSAEFFDLSEIIML